ncbi:MAG: hypothetical protein JO243_07780, partial [Solirubrobacterales bacterium]|nr:hypothetical protein [Solirubrobacterales bacterium]
EVLHAWRQLTAGRDLPDELTTVGRFLNLPPAPEIPDPIRGQSFVIVEAYHIGNPAQADELLAPLRRLGPINDTMAKVPMPALSHLHMDPPHPVPGAGDGMLLAELPSDAVNRFVQTAGEQAAFPLMSVELRHLQGELGRRRLDGGALSSIDAAYALYAVGMAPTPEMALAARAQITALTQAMAPWKAPHMYLNFAETSTDPASLWDTDAYDRLREIKTATDPEDRIRSNHPVPSA